ncbi:MAG: hypothetical protein H6978_04405 [Gammaproteobacteria bacterium]|nr:hypothetical protein [Gammaproteobacteria bacterium]
MIKHPAAILLSGYLLFPTAAHSDNSNDTGPLPVTERVAGVSQLEWSQRWWQWAFSFDESRSPIADTTGQYCASRQSGQVWFLAGTYGTRRTIRKCKVPAGKYLFFPIINYVTFLAERSDETCSSLLARAARLTDKPLGLALEIDGKRFDSARIARLATAGCFSLVPGSPPDAASNGYFVMLPPLSPGRHLIEFAGVLPTMAQAVTYELQVEE